MVSLPLERLLAIAICQSQPGVVVLTDGAKPPTGVWSGAPVDTYLAARMAANALRLLLGMNVWQKRHCGPDGLVGQAHNLRLLIWMERREDEQPGLVVIWDEARPAPTGSTGYGVLLRQPVLVIGRNLRSGEHFVMRYVPGPWLERLQQLAYEAVER